MSRCFFQEPGPVAGNSFGPVGTGRREPEGRAQDQTGRRERPLKKRRVLPGPLPRVRSRCRIGARGHSRSCRMGSVRDAINQFLQIRNLEGGLTCVKKNVGN